MNVKKLRLGLIGKDISKSKSQKMHTFILAQKGVVCEYENFSVSPSDFDWAMRRLTGDFDGFNVTIPYKRDVFSYLEEIDEEALSCGAVNTVINAEKKGYTTDGAGFMLMLENAGVAVHGKKVLVLGVGGSGRSCAVALKKAGAHVFLYRRNQEELAEICAELGLERAEYVEQGGFDIVINCTGVGMHESEGRSPVGEKAFRGASVAVDLIYEPKCSKFLEIAASLGLKTVNGEAMLFYQAYFADCLYLGIQPNRAEAEDFYKKYLAE